MGLRDLLERFIRDYRNVFEEVWRTGVFTNEFGNLVRHDIAGEVRRIAKGVNDIYVSKGSVGQTKWTPVPWIAIFDERITNKATAGEYIVYLLNSETQELYLTFNQASESKNNASVRQKLQEKATYIRKKMAFPDSVSLGEINSGNTAYDAGCICSVRYSLHELPEEKQLIDDLLQFIGIYATYYEKFYNLDDRSNNWWPSLEEYNPNLTKEDWKKYILEGELPNHPSPMKMLKGMMLLEGEASCKQLSEIYGGHPSVYAGCAMNLGRRVKKYFNLPACMDGEQERYFPFPFLGKRGTDSEPNNYVYRIRAELFEALKEIDLSNVNPNYESGEERLSTKEILKHINDYIAAKGFTFDKGLIENYYLSLKSKPFTILAGTSGTGKTRLVRLFAEAIGATPENGRYKLVPVRPDWSDSSDLFGHVDLNGNFIPGAIIDFINEAAEDLPHPYFLCLDEMNLARVEYYLSDILSIIETREYKEDGITTDLLVSEHYYGGDTKALEKYGEIRIPENLYIIGTVNMDETTFPFSRKVLDRANTIEFSKVDLLANFNVPAGDMKSMDVSNDFMKADYVFFRQCASKQAYVEEACVELQEINKILEQANAHVGYRVRDEIVFYMLNNKNAELLERNEAFDNAIMQKILPRIQGSSASVKNMLCELFKYCAGDYDGYQTENDNISSGMFKVAKGVGCKYKKSAEKIAFMVRRFEEDGFTTYWF